MMSSNADRCLVIFAYNRPVEFRLSLDAAIDCWDGDIIVFIDGPRNDHDKQQQNNILRAIPGGRANIKVIHRNENYGLARSIVSGISSAFESYEFLMIVEDDCVITKQYIEFCLWADENFRSIENIGSVSGINFLPCSFVSDFAFLSKYHHCWGWATWKRAWLHFDFEMKGNLEAVVKNMSNRFEIGFLKYWCNIFTGTRNGNVESWAYRWLYSCWKHRFLSVTSRNCLVKNIGFNQNATHTKRVSIRNFTCFRPVFKPEENIKRNKLNEFITSMWHYATFWQR